MSRGNLRLATVLGLAAVMLASVAMVGTAAFGKNNKPSAAQYQYKVTVCHRTMSKKKPFRTINVSSRAVPAHLNHGDTLGACPTSTQATSSTSSSASGKGNGKGNGQGQGNGNGQVNGNGNGNGKGNGK